MWSKYFVPESLEEALQLLSSYFPDVRIIAGGTDLMRDIDGGKCDPAIILDIGGIEGFGFIKHDGNGDFHIGPQVTHGDIVSEPLIRRYVLPLAQSCLHVGSPQIRNRGTVVGNIMTASPAADTLPALFVMGAEIELYSQGGGKRVIPIKDFFLGPKKTVAKRDELVTGVNLRSLRADEKGCSLKLADRQAMGISIVNLAVRLKFTENQTITDAEIAFGSVGPTVMRAFEAEQLLTGEELSEAVIKEAVSIVKADISPISDIRGSAEYRTWMAEVLLRKALILLKDDQVRADWPVEPVTLSLHGRDDLVSSGIHDRESDLEITINGKGYSVPSGFNKTLLHLIRDDVGLTGTKKGCGEGRCGACSVILDGKSVLSCLVPAANAHKRNVLTIEGVASLEDAAPLREAFVAEGAIQCGYCTPGFMMSAYSLKQTGVKPTRGAIAEALAGNLCRCTGYKRILSAVEKGLTQESDPIQS